MTFRIFCPCGCGETVEAHDAGFAATSVTVQPCRLCQGEGMVSYTIRKSVAYELTVPAQELRHRLGLVTFGS